jgi:hypothetical protein
MNFVTVRTLSLGEPVGQRVAEWCVWLTHLEKTEGLTNVFQSEE